jgi:hypothetical protein
MLDDKIDFKKNYFGTLLSDGIKISYFNLIDLWLVNDKWYISHYIDLREILFIPTDKYILKLFFDKEISLLGIIKSKKHLYLYDYKCFNKITLNELSQDMLPNENSFYNENFYTKLCESLKLDLHIELMYNYDETD